MSAVPGGFVATVGGWTEPDSVWFSNNGTAWTKASTVPNGLNPRLSNVVSLKGTLAGVWDNSLDTLDPMTAHLTLWTSTVGRTWQLAPSIAVFDLGIVRDSASDGERLVVVGVLYSAQYPGGGQVWVGVPA